MYERILVAYDGSDGGTAALERGAALAADSGATLTVMEAIGDLEDRDQSVALEPEAEAEALSRLMQAIAAVDADIVCNPRVDGGHPVRAVVDVAEEISADLIVTGSRGEAMIPQAVLGRVSSGIVNRSPCDVLVVHPISN